MIAIFISKTASEYEAYCGTRLLANIPDSTLVSKTCGVRLPYRVVTIGRLSIVVCNGDAKCFSAKQNAMRKGWLVSAQPFKAFIIVPYAIVQSRHLDVVGGVYVFAHMGGDADFSKLESAADLIMQGVPQLGNNWHFSMLSSYVDERRACFDLTNIILPETTRQVLSLYNKFKRLRALPKTRKTASDKVAKRGNSIKKKTRMNKKKKGS